ELIVFYIRQARDVVALEAAVQRCWRQVRDRRLQGVEAVIQGQQRVPAKGDDDRLFLDRQHGRPGLLRPSLPVIESPALPPLRHRLRIDPVAPGQNPQAFLTILYCSTNRRCRAGATVENLAHSASFHCWPNNAPSNPGTKHLVMAQSFAWQRPHYTAKRSTPDSLMTARTSREIRFLGA